MAAFTASPIWRLANSDSGVSPEVSSFSTREPPSSSSASEAMADSVITGSRTKPIMAFLAVFTAIR